MKTLPRLRRGRWRPGRTSLALFVIQVVITVTCAIRGLDYLRHDSDPASVLSKVQDSAPLPVWGVAFLVAAGVIVLGQVGRWGQVIAIGHLLAMACYGSIGYGLLQVTDLGPGIRTPMGLLGSAVVHGTLGLDILAVLRRREVTAELLDRDGPA